MLAQICVQNNATVQQASKFCDYSEGFSKYPFQHISTNSISFTFHSRVVEIDS